MAKKRNRNSPPGKPEKHPHDAPGSLGSIPELLVPASVEMYVKPAGYRCRKCGFETSKTGYRGRQAMRAHMRVHVRTRRAWKRGSLLAGLVLLVTIIVLYQADYLEWLIS